MSSTTHPVCGFSAVPTEPPRKCVESVKLVLKTTETARDHEERGLARAQTEDETRTALEGQEPSTCEILSAGGKGTALQTNGEGPAGVQAKPTPPSRGGHEDMRPREALGPSTTVHCWVWVCRTTGTEKRTGQTVKGPVRRRHP